MVVEVIVPPKLMVLDIGLNLINGTIPSWVFQLPALKYLNLSHNELIGNTLEFQSSSLEIIDLSKNLTHLILSSNSFSGTIPRSNRFSENLNVLALKMNNFSGTIHDSFTKRNNLTTINLYGNGFEGPVPKSLINCRNLEVLDLGRNNFFEEFPHWLGNLPSLHVSILQSNKFHGSIVTVTSTTKFPVPMLRVLDMENNNFTGPLPIKLEIGKPNLVDYFSILKKIDRQRIRRQLKSHFGDTSEMFGRLIDERLKLGRSGKSGAENDVIDILLGYSVLLVILLRINFINGAITSSMVQILLGYLVLQH
ncbi:hypothetical protein RHSIM_Rhsim01G0065900 [Rhododendron simsii]|uniref:Uncharacterized protein n=1 Tax=Rhododendron simsii TaxID=118357 RepID=A0A834HJF9_RHOSS|nr:hypothetical protein RHSIM_Rhsim01G0065900 [Rhododendron simsii]